VSYISTSLADLVKRILQTDLFDANLDMGYLQPYWLDLHFCPSEDEPDLPSTAETGLMAIDSQNPFVQPFDEDIRPRILKYLEGGGITDSSVTVCDSSEGPIILVGGTLDAVQKDTTKGGGES
jgi:hypothetical protein